MEATYDYFLEIGIDVHGMQPCTQNESVAWIQQARANNYFSCQEIASKESHKP